MFTTGCSLHLDLITLFHDVVCAFPLSFFNRRGAYRDADCFSKWFAAVVFNASRALLCSWAKLLSLVLVCTVTITVVQRRPLGKTRHDSLQESALVLGGHFDPSLELSFHCCARLTGIFLTPEAIYRRGVLSLGANSLCSTISG